MNKTLFDLQTLRQELVNNWALLQCQRIELAQQCERAAKGEATLDRAIFAIDAEILARARKSELDSSSSK